jgi:hypothetical protein
LGFTGCDGFRAKNQHIQFQNLNGMLLMEVGQSGGCQSGVWAFVICNRIPTLGVVVVIEWMRVCLVVVNAFIVVSKGHSAGRPRLRPHPLFCGFKFRFFKGKILYI